MPIDGTGRLVSRASSRQLQPSPTAPSRSSGSAVAVVNAVSTLRKDRTGLASRGPDL